MVEVVNCIVIYRIYRDGTDRDLSLFNRKPVGAICQTAFPWNPGHKVVTNPRRCVEMMQIINVEPACRGGNGVSGRIGREIWKIDIDEQAFFPQIGQGHDISSQKPGGRSQFERGVWVYIESARPG